MERNAFAFTIFSRANNVFSALLSQTGLKIEQKARKWAHEVN